MSIFDFLYFLQWWIYFFVIGLVFLPLSNVVFSKFLDKGYIFSKILGVITITYLIFLSGIFHILPFTILSVYSILFLSAIANILIYKKYSKIKFNKKFLLLLLFEEFVFFASLFAWTYIKGFQPDIYGLEKYMDYGFINSILRSTYFPPKDIWFAGEAINYYYFGHLATAVLTRLSQLPSYLTFNLMLATIFAFTITGPISLVSTLTYKVFRGKRTSILTGILAGIITTLGGNLHTIYALFKPYPSENPIPFWRLPFLPLNFPNDYWYPNATRFIPFTIHEFPAYSFVVSDLHGHVLDIPFVLLTLGLILTLFLKEKINILTTILISFLLSILYMTNAWDGIIYFGLFSLSVFVINFGILKISDQKGHKSGLGVIASYFDTIHNKSDYIINSFKTIVIAAFGYFIFTFPFNLHFKPFVSGIGVLCAPSFLTKIGKLGPLLFEPNHCQHSPLWMLVILYGFFIFFAVAFFIKILNLNKIPSSIFFALILIIISFLLILTPEFLYAKDIYPAHYRANTMFKLGYQAFIMLSLVSSFSIAYLLNRGRKIIWFPIIFILLVPILFYPYFAIKSYFNNLSVYKGINGINYLKAIHPSDFDAISWINKNISDQPVILEAQGDSYTDFERISANTGLPTVLGWTVHEWLWRGEYKYPASRLDDVRALYEDDLSKTKQLIKKYNISYIYIGELEREKYPLLDESKFLKLGNLVYQNVSTKIYKVNSF